MLGFFFLLRLLGINAELVDPLPPGKIELSIKESAALNRLIQRLKQRQQQVDDSTDSGSLAQAAHLTRCPAAGRHVHQQSTAARRERAQGNHRPGPGE